jgi:hypothetical protein
MSRRHIETIEHMRRQRRRGTGWDPTPPEKMAATQSKNESEKKRGAGCPGPR